MDRLKVKGRRGIFLTKEVQLICKSVTTMTMIDERLPRISVSASAAPWLLLGSTNGSSKESGLGEPAGHNHSVVRHLQGEHAKALAGPGQHGLLQVGELAAPSRSFCFELLALTKQLCLSSLHLKCSTAVRRNVGSRNC